MIKIALYTTSFRGGITAMDTMSNWELSCTPPHFEGDSQLPQSTL